MYRPSRRASRVVGLSMALLAGVVTLANAHDMFAKPDRFFVGATEDVVIRILNGTFSQSENSIARPRVADIAVVSPGGRQTLDTTAWTTAGDTSTFRIRTTGAGTYVLGASTRPHIIALSASDFNLYLKEDGIPDVLAARQRDGELGHAVRERYHKHVKALIQAGDIRTTHFATVLGYPAEIIPVSNPYALRPGAVLSVRTLVDGVPVANQFVLYGGRTTGGTRFAQRSVRSDSAGIARVSLRGPGTWYVKFIHMRRLPRDTAADYESKWAALTFQVR